MDLDILNGTLDLLLFQMVKEVIFQPVDILIFPAHYLELLLGLVVLQMQLQHLMEFHYPLGKHFIIFSHLDLQMDHWQIILELLHIHLI